MNAWGALNILFGKGLIKVELTKHLPDILDGHPHTVTANWFEEKLDIFGVLHVGLFFDQRFILQNVLRLENGLLGQTFTNAIKKNLKLGRLILKAEGSVSVDYFLNLQILGRFIFLVLMI